MGVNMWQPEGSAKSPGLVRKTIGRVLRLIKNNLIRRVNFSLYQRINWEMLTKPMYERYEHYKDDYGNIAYILDGINPASVLDVGCGSGHLFPLYIKFREEKGFPSHVLGIDFSRNMLKLAAKNFPDIETVRMRAEDMNFGYKRFDLAISIRVLDLIHPNTIESVIRKICFSSKFVYISEATEVFHGKRRDAPFVHDYGRLFGSNGFALKGKPTAAHADDPATVTCFLFTDERNRSDNENERG